ncbi:MAG: methyltransferase domain-containing protein [Carbonactinosporaceae bacterium]
MKATRGHWVFAALYDALSRCGERAWVGPVRAELVRDLTGEVLEVGAGTGLNLRHYRAASRVVAAEPDPSMRRRLRSRIPEARVPVEVSHAAAEELPFENGRFEAVVYTLVLCSVGDLERALAEARRVLRPGGRFVVFEHVRAPGRMGGLQDRADAVWPRIAAGCHLNRDTGAAIERAGFTFEDYEMFRRAQSVPLVNPFIRGVAR